MARVALLLSAFVAQASAEAVTLTPDNFASEFTDTGAPAPTPSPRRVRPSPHPRRPNP